jgi:hypothetical protein
LRDDERDLEPKVQKEIVMRNSFLAVAALLVSTTLASAAPALAQETAGSDYCTSGVGFAPCPKLVWDAGSAASQAPVDLAAVPGEEVAYDWCTAGAGFAKCARLGQTFAARDWRGPVKFAGIGAPIE